MMATNLYFMIKGDAGMPGREGSPGSDGNEVHGVFYLFVLRAGTH